MAAARRLRPRHTTRAGEVAPACRLARRIVAIAATARILEKLIALVEGVVEVQGRLEWELDDSTLQPAGDVEPEPTAASVTAREHPQPLHR